jgi:hypothetical protein
LGGNKEKVGIRDNLCHKINHKISIPCEWEKIGMIMDKKIWYVVNVITICFKEGKFGRKRRRWVVLSCIEATILHIKTSNISSKK